MITPDLKVSKMIDKYPATLNVLLNASPHFNKLNNMFLRKTIASRVTIQQAASVAGVSLTNLLIELNKTINTNFREEDLTMDTPGIGSVAEPKQKPGILDNTPKEKMIELDVRDDIKNGKDPIYRIKPVVQSLKEGEVLHLINSFEPVPLYSVLGNKGLSHWTEKKESIFHIYFYKDPLSKNEQKETSSETVQVNSGKVNSEPEGEGIIEIDVRDLTPPEPMVKILSILPELTDTSVLLVHHHREPMMLYEKLEERGFTAVAHKLNDNYYKVVITKKSN